MTKFYKGGSTSPSDIIVNFKDNKVYKGNSSSPSDIIMNFEKNWTSELTPLQIVMIYLVLTNESLVW
ncbi:MAG: hypothetical protein LBQ46_10715 [Treponema sp.]|jgi:hypothetical protein|nr:hypothetical protein [Treponema sp.]